MNMKADPIATRWPQTIRLAGLNLMMAAAFILAPALGSCEAPAKKAEATEQETEKVERQAGEAKGGTEQAKGGAEGASPLSKSLSLQLDSLVRKSVSQDSSAKSSEKPEETLELN